MAPTIGRLALHNRSYGSILGDWVAPPPQNIHPVLLTDAESPDQLLSGIIIHGNFSVIKAYFQVSFLVDGVLETFPSLALLRHPREIFLYPHEISFRQWAEAPLVEVYPAGYSGQASADQATTRKPPERFFLLEVQLFPLFIIIGILFVNGVSSIANNRLQY